MAQFTDSELHCLLAALDRHPAIKEWTDHTLHSLLDKPVTTTTLVETCKGAVQIINRYAERRSAAQARMASNRRAVARTVAKAKAATGKGGNNDKGGGKRNGNGGQGSDRSRVPQTPSSPESSSSSDSESGSFVLPVRSGSIRGGAARRGAWGGEPPAEGLEGGRPHHLGPVPPPPPPWGPGGGGGGDRLGWGHIRILYKAPTGNVLKHCIDPMHVFSFARETSTNGSTARPH